jgi:hypothetical protein
LERVAELSMAKHLQEGPQGYLADHEGRKMPRHCHHSTSEVCSLPACQKRFKTVFARSHDHPPDQKCSFFCKYLGAMPVPDGITSTMYGDFISDFYPVAPEGHPRFQVTHVPRNESPKSFLDHLTIQFGSKASRLYLSLTTEGGSSHALAPYRKKKSTTVKFSSPLATGCPSFSGYLHASLTGTAPASTMSSSPM